MGLGVDTNERVQALLRGFESMRRCLFRQFAFVCPSMCTAASAVTVTLRPTPCAVVVLF